MSLEIHECWGKKALFFDTETTGVPRKGATLHRQPHLVQLAWTLLELPDGEGSKERVICSGNFMVRLPDGVKVPEGAAAVHGISTVRTRVEGFPIIDVLDIFGTAYDICDVVVAHNARFDTQILDFENRRHYPLTANGFGNKPVLCTQELSAPILNLPPTPRMIAAGYGDKPKAPRLEEAHRHFTGVDFEGAHDAMVDVNALVRVFMALLYRTHPDPQQEVD